MHNCKCIVSQILTVFPVPVRCDMWRPIRVPRWSTAVCDSGCPQSPAPTGSAWTRPPLSCGSFCGRQRFCRTDAGTWTVCSCVQCPQKRSGQRLMHAANKNNSLWWLFGRRWFVLLVGEWDESFCVEDGLRLSTKQPFATSPQHRTAKRMSSRVDYVQYVDNNIPMLFAIVLRAAQFHEC